MYSNKNKYTILSGEIILGTYYHDNLHLSGVLSMPTHEISDIYIHHQEYPTNHIMLWLNIVK